mmetsp:Transcript_129732/g.361365  ORF Transcript_129732/g.361365 Transcript_129732/m.361365 type:complete len:377 (-) Transcript_129732:1428-2558(-)
MRGVAHLPRLRSMCNSNYPDAGFHCLSLRLINSSTATGAGLWALPLPAALAPARHWTVGTQRAELAWLAEVQAQHHGHLPRGPELATHQAPGMRFAERELPAPLQIAFKEAAVYEAGERGPGLVLGNAQLLPAPANGLVGSHQDLRLGGPVAHRMAEVAPERRVRGETDGGDISAQGYLSRLCQETECALARLRAAVARGCEEGGGRVQELTAAASHRTHQSQQGHVPPPAHPHRLATLCVHLPVRARDSLEGIQHNVFVAAQCHIGARQFVDEILTLGGLYLPQLRENFDVGREVLQLQITTSFDLAAKLVELHALHNPHHIWAANLEDCIPLRTGRGVQHVLRRSEAFTPLYPRLGKLEHGELRNRRITDGCRK